MATTEDKYCVDEDKPKCTSKQPDVGLQGLDQVTTELAHVVDVDLDVVISVVEVINGIF